MTLEYESSFFISRIFKFFVIYVVQREVTTTKQIHNLHWKKSDPIFELHNNKNIIDVNVGNSDLDYDQVNIICSSGKFIKFQVK